MYNNNTITTILIYSDISLYLGAEEYEKEKYYNWVDETDRLEMINIVADVVRYYQPYLGGTNQFDKLVGYLYALIGHWIAQAAVISGNTHGVIVGQPIAPASTSTGMGQIQVVVGAPGSPIIDQQSTYTSTLFIGKTIIVVVDGIIIETYLPLQFSYSFNAANGTISFNAPLNVNQVVTVVYFG
jgi:hypothetical protein